MDCPNCGYRNPPDQRFCVNCKLLLGQPASPTPPRPNQAQQLPAYPAHNSPPQQPSSVPQSPKTQPGPLARLGLRFNLGQGIGCIGGVLVGLVVARALPYIYPIFSARLLDLIFGPGYSPLRDGFNSNLMTACTCLSSFLVALAVSLAFSRRKRLSP